MRRHLGLLAATFAVRILLPWQANVGIEFKLTDAPTVTPSMRSALRDLKLRSLSVVHAGEQSFPMVDGIRAIAISPLDEELPRLRGRRRVPADLRNAGAADHFAPKLTNASRRRHGARSGLAPHGRMAPPRHKWILRPGGALS